ncbi:MAG TPA: class I SAM-dependent methyltransferase [Solirubrobacteraceae bacterium]|nr:class I SAM-dependent methyltransferase [Solirubrobacteraceae bacterium]
MEHRLAEHQRDWDDLARLDPLWAIASAPDRRHGAWGDDEFMATGRRKAAGIVRTLDRLGAPAARRRALDFGCGVGRVTLPLADHFDQAVGVDIAPAMVKQARARACAAGRDDVRFLLNEREELKLSDGERFDLVYTALVLQHLPSREHVSRCARGLARLVAPGGVFMAQMPARLAPWARLQPGRRAYASLRSAGVPRTLLYRRLGLHPMRLLAFSRPAFEALLEQEGLQVAGVLARRRHALVSCTYLAIRPGT